MAAPMENNVKSNNLENDFSVKARCRYFITKKGRKCNLEAKAMIGYCGEHWHVAENGEKKSSDCSEVAGSFQNQRVQCPLNPRHTCWSNKLEKHLKVCQKQQEAIRNSRPVYYKENINSGDIWLSDNEDELGKITANTVPRDEVVKLIERVERLHAEHCEEVIDRMMIHKSMEKVLSESTHSAGDAIKHLQQEASILAHLQDAGLLTSDAVYVEFGAGNGHLTYWMGRELGKDATILAVDRFTVRHKFDRRQDFEEKNSVIRLKIDIEHLDLNSVPEIADTERRVVGYSKHLCGPATDLCFRCVVNTLTNGEDGSRLEGLVIALCCHHKGSWRHYVGKDFFRESGLTSRDYQIIQSLTSWAVCGFHQKPTVTGGDTTDDVNTYVTQPAVTGGDTDAGNPTVTGHNGEWSPARRRTIGLKCKRLLDAGRVRYLQQHGYTAQFRRYVDASVSKENVLMVVRRRRSADVR